MRAKRVLGHVLLWTGFLAGAFVSVRRAEVSADPWSSISWPAYGLALSIAVCGVVLLRVTKRGLDGKTVAGAAAIDQLFEILQRLSQTVEGWRTRYASLSVYDIHQLIDSEAADDLRQFADLREAMIAAYGLDHYARVMTEFALAERTINRAWSASADGYVDEVAQCLEHAALHLAAATGWLDRARDATQKD
jgi:hypothetical protein